MTAHANIPALPARIGALVEEYDRKLAAIPDVIRGYKEAHTDVDRAVTVGGAYSGRPYSYHPSLHETEMERILRQSAWKHAYQIAMIDRIAPASDRSRFETALQDPPAFTADNVIATFGDYLKDARFHILRGLAECFIGLDPAYKSHSKVKIGVEGLPKRIILSSVFGEYSYGSHGEERLKDTISALRVYRSELHIEWGEFRQMRDEAKRNGEADWDGGTVKAFQNGNAHLIFNKTTLLEINRALAEFYGDVLPDSPEEQDEARRRPGTEVSRDLAFYWTPEAAAARLLAETTIRDGQSILEPSCGEGHLMKAIRAHVTKERIRDVRMAGIEVHGARAATARGKGFSVHIGNFLQAEPNPIFDHVVMNPPFAGQHWRKHIAHAMRFLKPLDSYEHRWDAGVIAAILPTSAHVDGHLKAMGLVYSWHDLPVASFREAGTNVPTGIMTASKQEVSL